MQKSDKSKSYQRLWLGACYFTFFAMLGLVIPYLPLYLHHKGLNSLELGILFSVAISARIIAPNIWAYLADTKGKRTQIVRLGAFLALISFALLYISDSFIPLLIVNLLFNFFWNAILAQLEVLTLNFLGKDSHRYSNIRLWGSIGFIVNVTLGAWVIEYFSLDAILHLGMFTMAFLLISTCLLSVENQTEVSLDTTNIKDNTEVKSLVTPLFSRHLWPFWFSVLLLQVSFGPYYTFFLIYMTDLGWSTSLAGALISLGVLAEIVMFLYSARLLRCFSIYSLLTIALLLTSLRWLMLAYVADNLYCLIVAQILHAASFALAHAVSMAFLNQTFSSKFKGRAQAFYASIGFGLGGAGGALFAGIFWQDGQGAQLTFVLAGLIAFVGVIILIYSKNQFQACTNKG